MNLIWRSLAGALSIIVAVAATPLWAGPNEYVFEPVTVNIRKGDASELAVRFVHKPTGKLVEGATLLRTRLDMSPENMASMTVNHTALPSTGRGLQIPRRPDDGRRMGLDRGSQGAGRDRNSARDCGFQG